MTDQPTIQHPDQPDGIADDSRDLPDIARAARRVGAYITEWGDGLIGTAGLRPLYARDLEALRRAALQLAEVTVELEYERKARATFEEGAAGQVEDLRDELARVTADRDRLEQLHREHEALLAKAKTDRRDDQVELTALTRVISKMSTAYLASTTAAASVPLARAQGVIAAARTWRDAWGQNGNTLDADLIDNLVAAVDALDGVSDAEPEQPVEAATWLIWSHHHGMWWGPNGAGYRAYPADAGRYTLTATRREMRRGCGCCQVPEVPVDLPAAPLASEVGTEALRQRIAEATHAAVEAGRVNQHWAEPTTVDLPTKDADPDAVPARPTEDVQLPAGDQA